MWRTIKQMILFNSTAHFSIVYCTMDYGLGRDRTLFFRVPGTRMLKFSGPVMARVISRVDGSGPGYPSTNNYVIK